MDNCAPYDVIIDRNDIIGFMDIEMDPLIPMEDSTIASILSDIDKHLPKVLKRKLTKEEIAAKANLNSAKISHLETQIINNNKCMDHLVDITALHENHFRAVDQKVDDMADKLATLLRINKVHFAKMTDFMEQNFSIAVAIV